MKKNNSLLKRVLFVVLALAFYAVPWAQTKTITGVVKDATGESIIGASVVVKGTTLGTITNINGSYSLGVPTSAKTLVVSYIGMETQELTITGSVINVALKDATTDLDELVVVGYGVVKKRDLTGSVSSVKSSEIMKTSSSNAMQAMQGKVPGLDIQQSSGQAGAGLNITLRGNRSITASNNPLILVDGVEYGSTLDISPSDIESMEVLKDASSTAIYGTRGANGVIIITTKRGKSGATKVSFNSYISSNQPTSIPQIMFGTTEVTRRIQAERYKRDKLLVTNGTGTWGDSQIEVTDVLSSSAANGLPYSEMDIYNNGSYTNWADLILQNGLTQNYEMAVSGGSEKTNFNISLGTMLEEGLLKNDALDRYNAKINIDHKANKFLKIGTSLLYTYKNHDKRANVFGQALKMTSIANPYDADGQIILKPSPTYEAHANPLLDEIEGNYQNNIESTRFFGNGYIEITPIRNVFFKSMFALDRNVYRDGLYQDYQSVGKLQAASGSYISVEDNSKTAYTWENTMNFNTDFGGSQHNLTTLIGHSQTQGITETRTISGNTAAEHYYTSSFYDVKKIITPVVSSGYVQSQMLSFFGRLNYRYLDKYLLTASVRADGSSVLSDSHKWGYFPSVSAAWRINEESFLKETDWLDNLKLRASWGLSGNAAVDAYGTLTTVSNSTDFPVYYYLNGKQYSGSIANKLGNENLEWEKTSSLNFGLDFGILKNRISGSVDVYFTNTYDLLYLRSLPASSVFTQVLDNIGETKGNGIEVSLNTKIVDNRDFKWDINWSASMAQDQITKLSNGITKNINGTTGQIVGQPVNIFYNYESDGCWGVGEYDTYKADWLTRHPDETMTMTGEAGTIKIIDTNDDGKLTDDDKRIYNRNPNAILGMNNSFTYKNFSLSVLVFARLGGYLQYDFNNLVTYDGSNWGDLDYWTLENQDAKFPTPGNSTNWSSYSSATLYEDASYLKIKDITLSYTLPKNILSKVGVSNAKFYASMKNYFTFSSIDNYDSERGGAITFPLAKQIVFGTNIEF